MERSFQGRFVALRTLIGLAVLAAGQPAFANDDTSGEFDFRIEERTLGKFMDRLHDLTRLQLIYPHELADAGGIHPVVGKHTVEEALAIALKGTGFTGGLTSGGVIVISRSENEEAQVSNTRKKRNGLWGGLLALLASAVNPGVLPAQEASAVAQEAGQERGQQEQQQEHGEVEGPLELRDVTVTGSRISRSLSEVSGNLIVLDRDAIRASGELTLPRVLRQLPQNINSTNETYGSHMTGDITNISGASTVNLRGLGSESTLILVDGRRVGYSGLLGGVTDISTIPLSMVERIEILLDGAAALYGSDAVGGVVNVITRKDYSGVELDANYSRPHKSGFEETRVSVSTGLSWVGGRANIGYEYFRDSGLDASARDTLIFANRNDLPGINPGDRGLPGPQIRVYSFLRPCNATRAIVYELDGRILSRNELFRLAPPDQARATCHADLTVPTGFMPGDDFNGIEIFGAPNWGEGAEFGVSLRPEQNHNVVSLSMDQAITDSLDGHANIRWGKKKTNKNDGINHIDVRLHPNSPFNPFGVEVFTQGQILNAPPKLFDSDKDELFLRLGLEGSLGSGWTWQADLGRSQEKVSSRRSNVLDINTVLGGVASDGMSEVRLVRELRDDEASCEDERVRVGGTRYVYVFGNCSIYGVPAPINPFGDLSPYVIPGLNLGSRNEQIQFEALARGELFKAPGGPIALVVGYDYHKDTLESFSEFFNRFSTERTEISSGESPVGTDSFDTSISRDTHAAFFEALVPLVNSGEDTNSERLNLTVAGRYDSYSGTKVGHGGKQAGATGADKTSDPGSEFSYTAGLMYRINESALLKVNRQTSFVTPQMYQLILPVQERTPALPFNGLFFTQPDSKGRLDTHSNVFENSGGNDTLKAETAETLSLTAELSPAFLPGLFLRASWSNTRYKDRIAYFFSLFDIDPDNLPSNVTYLPEEDIYLRENRWINVSRLKRTGIDYELRYEWEIGRSEFDAVLRRSTTSRFDLQVDPQHDEPQSLLTLKDLTLARNAPLQPVPRYQDYLQFMWSYGGLFASVDLQGAAETRTRYALRGDPPPPATGDGPPGGGGDGPPGGGGPPPGGGGDPPPGGGDPPPGGGDPPPGGGGPPGGSGPPPGGGPAPQIPPPTLHERVTEPAVILDMVVGYDFQSATLFDAPAWMDGLRITLTINNLTDSYARNREIDLDTGEIAEYSINPTYEWTQGRTYRLTVHKSF